MARSRQPEGGFTIIELLIVLAVAGLIFIIMLNAIPAMLRNARNNQRKQDVAAILSAVSHYQLNHSGNFPPNTPVAGDDYLQYTKLSFYDKADVKVTHQTAGAGSQVQTDDTKVNLYNYNVCGLDTDNGKSTSDAAGYRDIVALYRIETSGGTAAKCQQL